MTVACDTRTNKDGSTTYSKTINLGFHPVTGKRRQTRVSAKSVRELKRRHTEVLHKVQNGNFIDPSKAQTAEYLIHWLSTIKPAVRGSSYRRFSEIVRGRLIPKFGNVPLAKLSPLHIQELHSECLSKGFSPSTVTLYHNVVHRALEQAVKRQMILRNPSDSVDAPRERAPEMKTWNADQVRAFLAAAVEDRLSALWWLAVHTGMRRGELLALQWQDIDLDKKVLAVRRTLTRGADGLTFGEPKSVSGRRAVALPDVCIEKLRNHRIHQLEQRLQASSAWQDSDLAFERGDRRLLHPNTLSTAFTRLTKKSGLPSIRFHDLRHSAATLMLSNGVHPKIV